MADTLELVAESPKILEEASAMSYGDKSFCDYNWYFSLPLEDRAEWWEDMEKVGILPGAEFVEITKEWFHENKNVERAMILAEVTAIMLDSGLDALEP